MRFGRMGVGASSRERTFVLNTHPWRQGVHPYEIRQMTAVKRLRPTILGAILLCGNGAFVATAHAGGFAVREQPTTFLGTAFAGAAAGGDISSMYWNPAAAAAVPGCSSASSYTLVLGRSDETAESGLLTSVPGVDRSTDVGSDGLVPASYLACQLSDRLFAGVALNSEFGLLTKPDDRAWAGSPIAITSKIFTGNLNPTLAYKLTPGLTVGVGLQVEYFRIRLNHGSFASPLPLPAPLIAERRLTADDW